MAYFHYFLPIAAKTAFGAVAQQGGGVQPALSN
jgi:hypothetical protein